jgi:uncharacterized protein
LQRAEQLEIAARYLALTRADLDGSDLLNADVIWHVPGTSQVAGDYAGPDQVLAYFGKLLTLSDGSHHVTLEEVTEGSDRAVVWQRSRASKDGWKLDDDQCVRIRLTHGRIREAWLSPGDPRCHDEFWGTGVQPMFSPVDEETLASAIRKGTAVESTSLAAIAKTVVIAGAIAILLLAGYRGLQHWRPPVSLSLTSDQAAVRQLNLSGAGHPMSWKLDSAYVQSVQATGPESASIEIDLPIDPSACQRVAAELGSTCAGGAVVQGSPLTLAWTTPERLDLLQPAGGDQHSTALAVTVTPPAGPQATAAGSTPAGSAGTAGTAATAGTAGSAGTAGTAAAPAATATPATAGTQGTQAPEVTLAATAPSDQQRWCFDFPLSTTTLTIQRGDRTSHQSFAGAGLPIPCGSGLRLLIGTAGPAHQPPALTLSGIASLKLDAHSQSADVQGVAGQLQLGGAGSHVLGSPTEILVKTTSDRPLATVLELQAGRQTLALTSAKATAVDTDQGDLVNSVWDRQQVIVLPVFLALATAIVPLLIAALQSLVSLITDKHRRPDPLTKT